MPPIENSRDSELAKRYIEEDISVERLAIDTGLSTIRVKQILKAQGVSKKDKPPDLIEGDKTLSVRHVKIGLYVSHHRAFTWGVDRTHLGKLLGWSAIKVCHVEAGKFNLTLSDMDDLARIFEIPLVRLLEASEASTSSPPTS